MSNLSEYEDFEPATSRDRLAPRRKINQAYAAADCDCWFVERLDMPSEKMCLMSAVARMPNASYSHCRFNPAAMCLRSVSLESPQSSKPDTEIG